MKTIANMSITMKSTMRKKMKVNLNMRNFIRHLSDSTPEEIKRETMCRSKMIIKKRKSKVNNKSNKCINQGSGLKQHQSGEITSRVRIRFS